MTMTRVFSRRAVCAAALMIVPAVMAAAFQLQPMSATIELDGSTPTTTFEVSNATDQPVAVQMRTTGVQARGGGPSEGRCSEGT